MYTSCTHLVLCIVLNNTLTPHHHCTHTRTHRHAARTPLNRTQKTQHTSRCCCCCCRHNHGILDTHCSATNTTIIPKLHCRHLHYIIEQKRKLEGTKRFIHKVMSNYPHSPSSIPTIHLAIFVGEPDLHLNPLLPNRCPSSGSLSIDRERDGNVFGEILLSSIQK